MEEKSNLLSEQVAKSANNLEGKSGVAKRTCSVIKQVRGHKSGNQNPSFLTNSFSKSHTKSERTLREPY